MVKLTKEQDEALAEAITALQHGQQAYLALGRFLTILKRKGLLDQSDVLEVLAEMEQGHDKLSRALWVLLGQGRPPAN